MFDDDHADIRNFHLRYQGVNEPRPEIESPEFVDLVSLISESTGLGKWGWRVTEGRTDEHGPTFVAHVTLDGYEYITTIQPTKL